ncbi:Hypothetical protein FKW44_010436 [Caligus rogercresseyi]|uniref:Uncharacterized protein n=1 Tax=Caligus rogercresseyi TaxID=217165 RepID=A0A7T8HGJ9_CALRO|nr:Hypothetical protein FKW44_010436 [Caligus rogercresseyi]
MVTGHIGLTCIIFTRWEGHYSNLPTQRGGRRNSVSTHIWLSAIKAKNDGT